MALHADSLNEAGFVQDTLAAIADKQAYVARETEAWQALARSTDFAAG